MRITQKLGVLVAVPLCAVSGFGALALVTSGSQAMRAGQLWNLMNTADSAGSLTARLQDERTAVTVFLMAPTGSAPVEGLDDQTSKTDAAIADYRRLSAGLHQVPQATADLLKRIDDDLTALPALRGQIRAGSAPALSAVVFQYRMAIADLMALQAGVAQAGSAPPDIAGTISAASALTGASESSGEEVEEVLRLAIGTRLTPNTQQIITVARTGYTAGLETFAAIAAPDWRARPQQALAGPAVAEAARLEDTVARTLPGGTVQIDPALWISAMSAREQALDGVREDLDRSILSAIAKERDDQQLLAGVEAASVAGTVLIALLLSLRLGRPMIKGLRQLRATAHAVAYERLPAAVEALHAQGALLDRTPEQFADQIGPAIEVSGSDEIAAVGRAFNAVHREAVRTAADMELLRAGVGEAFVALARRGQRLTGALTVELDEAERDEQDPDRLARLFVLDHLAARMTRNNESLLVLGGEGTARVRDQGVTLLDVVRAATGRIERYTRVDAAIADLGITMVPGVVEHLVHLFAELLDNATAFSSPDSRVTVDAGRLADRVIVQVADRGIGLSPKQRDEFNARLATPSVGDITAVRAMGLTVTARLAAWYGIAVELRPRHGGGTIAEVALPETLYSAAGSPTTAPAQVAVAGWQPLIGSGSALAGTPRVPAPSRRPPTEAPPSPPSLPSPPSPMTPMSPVPAPRSLPGPGQGPGQGPGPDPTTRHGLPQRIPLASLPAEAAAALGEWESPGAEDQRDPAQVSSVLAAYARGIGTSSTNGSGDF